MNTAATSQLNNANIEAILKMLHLEARQYGVPLWWPGDPLDANTAPHNTNCFFGETGDIRFGVTANHLICGNDGQAAGCYLSDRQTHAAR